MLVVGCLAAQFVPPLRFSFDTRPNRASEKGKIRFVNKKDAENKMKT